uniref:3'-5' exonuclease domain-containing protein n=1 Tax=Panagrolaimus sp. ES5 TaxID=591445 RepID=A0AC34FT06_9BILA
MKNVFKKEPKEKKKKKKKKNPKQPKPNPHDNPTIHIAKRLDGISFENILEKMKKCYLAGTKEEILNIFDAFIKECLRILNEKNIKCPRKYLREATLYLIGLTHHLFKDDTPKSDVNVQSKSDANEQIKLGLTEQIICGYQILLKENDDQFVLDVYNGNVSNDIWKYSLKVAVKLDVLKYFFVLNQLFHLFKFEHSRRETSLYIFIREMFYDQKTLNNALEWIQQFNLKLEYFKEPVTICCEKFQPMNLVETTSQKIYEFYSAGGILPELLSCIAEFFRSCLKESLRSATMELIYNTFLLLSNIKNSDSSLIIFEILVQFDAFLKEKGVEFSQSVCSAKVSDDCWKNSFKVSFAQRCAVVRKHDKIELLPPLDLLFNVHLPESDSRYETILNTMQEFIGNKNTLDIGIELVQALKFDLQNLKCKNAVEIVNENRPWLIYAQKIIVEFEKFKYDLFKYDLVNCTAVLNVFYFDPTDERLLSSNFLAKREKEKPDVEISVEQCPLEFLRPATMELILMIDLTKEASSELIFSIGKKFYHCAHATERFKYVNVRVPDKLWSNSYKRCIENRKLRNLEPSTTFESLFRINQPETKDRKDIIYESVIELLSQNKTRLAAIKWINAFNMTKIKEEQFGHVDIYSYLFENGLQFKENKIQYLDSLLKQVATDTLPTTLRRAEKKEYTINKLLNKICSEVSEEYLKENNLYASELSFIQKSKFKFESWDRSYFELDALEELKIKELDDKYKIWFLQSILSDKNYAYCWAKYLNISDKDIPKELKSCSFLKLETKINERKSFYVKLNSVEICHFWGKPYKLITILSPEIFNEFIRAYFIESKPKVIGIDVESGNSKEAAVLQLATSEWTVLIDIQELYDKFSADQWIAFFELLFHPEIVRIGTAFNHDYGFLCNKFPYLQELFLEKERKVLCLQKLANYFIKEEIVVEYFSILDLNMDKSLQKSNWAKRFLTQSQKIYAVTDAVVVVLIYEEFKKYLERWIFAQKM